MRNLTYTANLDNIAYKKADFDKDEIMQRMELLKDIPGDPSVNFHSFFVLDYTRRNYVLINTAISTLGYKPEELIEGGLDFIIHIYHKDDFAVFNEQVFPGTVKLLSQLPSEELKNYLFTFTYRLLKADKTYVNVLQRGKYITDDVTKLPVLSYGSTIDITNIKNDTCLNVIVEKLSFTNKIMSVESIVNQRFYTVPKEELFSKREKEILKWTADGMDAVAIAGKLFIAERTVINHRQNMLRKSNSKNVAELIGYAFRNGIIQ
jgi:DNA-binding CsgD family transcriptional regulator